MDSRYSLYFPGNVKTYNGYTLLQAAQCLTAPLGHYILKIVFQAINPIFSAIFVAFVF
jgi:hypothetical protein